MRPLKVGLGLPDWEGMMGGATARWSDLAAIARLGEEIGVDSIWVDDHFLGRLGRGTEGPWECLSMLAGLAAVTKRVELGTLVVCTSFRTPALTAKIADTIDEISGGRLILGLGSGWHEPEYRAMGIPFDYKVSRFEEAIQIIHALLREGRVDFEGEYYSARESELTPRSPRPNGPPILIGGRGPRMLRAVAQYADQWNGYYTWFDNDPSSVPPLLAEVDDACRTSGRDPGSLERSIALLVDVEGDSVVPEIAGMGVKALAGPPEEIAEALRTLAGEGIAHVQLYPAPMTLASVEGLAPVLEALDRS